MKKLFGIALVLTIIFVNLNVIHADIGTEIYINGRLLVSDVEPVIENGSTYVPIRALAESMGFIVSYVSETGRIFMEQPDLGVVIEMTVGSNIAGVNYEETAIPAAPFVYYDRTMVPVRFVSEALNSRVKWQEGSEGWDIYPGYPNKVIVESSYPVKLSSGNAAISSEIHTATRVLETLNKSEYEDTNGYDMVIPVFSGMKDKEFEQELNGIFKDHCELMKLDIDNKYEEQQNSVDEYGFSYTVFYNCSFSIVEENNNMLSFYIDAYEYNGGAHGMPIKTAFLVDFNESKILEIEDIFKPGMNYEQKLLYEMNTIIENSPIEYEYVESPTELPGNRSFYFEDGNLVFFYHPYHLASYARGFVEFKIPVSSLSDYLKGEYQ